VQGVAKNADDLTVAAETTASAINEMASTTEEMTATAESLTAEAEGVAIGIEQVAKSTASLGQKRGQDHRGRHRRGGERHRT